MSKTYRIAVIGIGGIGNLHAQAVGDLDNAVVVAGSCRTEEKGRTFADRFKCRWYADYRDMLDKETPDVATVATPSGLHLEPTQACAERGIHVICEKPLEITTERIDQMIEIADKAGITLAGIFPSRFNDVVKLIRSAVAEGRFGRLSIGAAYVPWWREDAYYSPDRWQGTLAMDGGGALMNQSIHNIDALQWMIGAAPSMPDLGPADNPVAEVFAYTARLGHDESLIEVEDTAVALLRFRDGTLGQLLGATSMYPGNERRIWVAGRDGTAEVREEQLAVFAFRDKRPDDQVMLEKYATQTQATGASDPLAISYDGHTANIGASLSSLDAGRPPDIGVAQARKAVAIIQAIYESAKTGKRVEVR